MATSVTCTPDRYESTFRIPCGVAAPLVANGGGFVGCSLNKDHEGQHEVTIRWER